MRDDVEARAGDEDVSDKREGEEEEEEEGEGSGGMEEEEGDRHVQEWWSANELVCGKVFVHMKSGHIPAGR
ncbi:hypothetical protein HDU96_005978 [Phlyctochytrium bullatum]|nr:hypothetical protein HDU96_005978 [Phlyctochytrium bullatum]